MRTTILCFLFVSGLLGLAISCCDIPEYWNMTSYQVEVFGHKNGSSISPTNDTIKTDSLTLFISFEKEFLSNSMPLGPNPFINNTYATSCPEEGRLGMKDELIDLQITSSLPFNNYPAGTSLTPSALINNTPASTWLADRQFNLLSINFWNIILTEKPAANSNVHDFKIRMIFESGREETIQLGALTWL